MSIRVIAQSNPFSVKREEKVFETGSSIQQICKELNIRLDIYAVRMSIDGEKELDISTIPSDGSMVLIKVIPAGEQAGQTAAGVGLILLGGVVTYFAGPIGLNLVAMGLGVIFQDEIAAGITAMVADAFGVSPDGVTNPSVQNNNYLSGGVNTVRKDGPVPVILGRHRYYPYQVAWPYKKFDNNSVFRENPSVGTWGWTTSSTPYIQSIKQVYLWGHKEVLPIASTYKRGETPIAELEGTNLSSNSLAQYGTSSKKFVNVSKELKAYKRDVTNANNGYTYVRVYLPSNISSVDITIQIAAFYLFNDEGKGGLPALYTDVFINDESGGVPIEVYRTSLRIRGVRREKEDTIPLTSCTFAPDYTLDPNKSYSIVVARQDDDPTDSDSPRATNFGKGGTFVAQSILSHVICYGNTDVISTEGQAQFNYSSLSIADISKDALGESQVTGDINDFNAIVQTYVRDYIGTGSGASQWVNGLTNNPASMMIYILTGSPNKRPVADSEIDWEAFEDFHDFCELMDYTCNMVIDNPGTIESILQTIALTGRASFSFTDKYSVIVDKERLAPTQMFTNKNSFGLSSNRNLDTDIHAIDYTFIDQEYGFQSQEVTVYKNGYNSDGTSGKIKATLKQSQTVVGVTKLNQIEELGRYRLNCSDRRIETINLSADVEYILCRRGDLVTVSYDELLIALERGRIIEVTSVALEITELLLDEYITMEVGKDYGITIRLDDGTQTQTTSLALVNSESTTNIVEFATPLAGVDILAGDLYSFGELGQETAEYIVLGITPAGELAAQLTLMNYAPEVYTMGDAFPPFTSNVALPSDFGPSLILEDVYNVDDVSIESQGNVSRIDTVVAPSLKYAIKTTIPAAYKIREDAFEVKLSDNYLYFIDKTDLKIYRATTLPEAARTLMVDTPVKSFDVTFDDTFIAYTDLTDNTNMYVKDLDTTTITQVTAIPTTSPVFIDNDQILYVNYNDGNKIYVTSVDDLLDGYIAVDFSTTSFGYYNKYVTYMDASTGTMYNKDIYDGDLEYRGDVYLTEAYTNVLATSPALWFAQGDVSPVYIDSNNQIAYINNEAYYGDVSRHAMDSKGNYVFVTPIGEVYFADLTGVDDKARLDAETVTQGFGENILCSFTLGSDRITNVAIEDIDKFTIGNTLSGIGIVLGTKVLLVGSGYVIMDNVATVTNPLATVNVAGELQCSTVIYDTRIRNISVDDIVKFSWNDNITGLGIQDATTVTFVGSDYVTMSKYATITDPTATVNVSGTRLLLNANKVVITGSIQARLLETNAINSIDRVASGNPNAGEQLYQHNLSTGIEQQYRDNGDLIRQFTPADGLWLRAGIFVGGDAPGGGTEVPFTPEFTDTTYEAFSQNTYPLTAVVGDSWYVTDNDVIHLTITYDQDTLYVKRTDSPDAWDVIGNYSFPHNTYRLVNNPPTIGGYPDLKEGDQWFNTGTVDGTYSANALYVLVTLATNEWEEITPTTLAQLDALQDAKLVGIEAGATNTPNIYRQGTIPTGSLSVADLWACTADVSTYLDGRTYSYTGSTWVDANPSDLADLDPAESAKLNGIEAGATNTPNIFRQATAPTATKVGDLWACTLTATIYIANITYSWSGTVWDRASATDLAELDTDQNSKLNGIEEGATNTAPVFRQTTVPSGQGEVDGSFWACTATFSIYVAGRTYVFDGISTWAEATPTDLAELDSTQNTKLNGIEAGATNNIFVKQATRPLTASIGDLWACTNTHLDGATTYYENTTYKFDGGIIWVSMGATGSSDFSTNTPDTIVSATVPTGKVIGTTWLATANVSTYLAGNVYVLASTSPDVWKVSAMTSYRQPTEPDYPQINDMWVCTANITGPPLYVNGTTYRYDGNSWELASDNTYDYFNEGGGAGSPSGTPNDWGIDGVTGKLTASGADIQGNIEADSGYFRGVVEVTKSNNLEKTVIDDGSIEFFYRSSSGDPWDSQGKLQAGQNSRLEITTGLNVYNGDIYTRTLNADNGRTLSKDNGLFTQPTTKTRLRNYILKITGLTSTTPYSPYMSTYDAFAGGNSFFYFYAFPYYATTDAGSMEVYTAKIEHEYDTNTQTATQTVSIHNSAGNETLIAGDNTSSGITEALY